MRKSTVYRKPIKFERRQARRAAIAAKQAFLMGG